MVKALSSSKLSGSVSTPLVGTLRSWPPQERAEGSPQVGYGQFPTYEFRTSKVSGSRLQTCNPWDCDHTSRDNLLIEVRPGSRCDILGWQRRNSPLGPRAPQPRHMRLGPFPSAFDLSDSGSASPARSFSRPGPMAPVPGLTRPGPVFSPPVPDTANLDSMLSVRSPARPALQHGPCKQRAWQAVRRPDGWTVTESRLRKSGGNQERRDHRGNMETRSAATHHGRQQG